MKKLDIKKLDIIKDKHFNYCYEEIKAYYPELDSDVCYKLCCEIPFDFNNINPEKEEYKYIDKEFYKFIDNPIQFNLIYKDFRTPPKNSKEEWNGIELIKAIKVNVCPYCGINYFSCVSKNEEDKEISDATLDHYLPQTKYKSFAMNLYNLIPSCKNCNETFKRNEIHIFNPYFHSLEDSLTFYLNKEDIFDLILNDFDKDIEINLKYDNNNELLKRHLKILLIKNRYNYFQDIIKSLIIKKQSYPENYINELKKLNIGITKTSIEDCLIKQDLLNDNEPFLKFKKDIWRQLKSIDDKNK